MVELKVQKFGDSTGILIPDEMLRRMGVRAGDRVYLVETPEGYLLTPFDEEARRQIKIGLELIERYRETYKRLAES
jgi:putative addiction module antidote